MLTRVKDDKYIIRTSDRKAFKQCREAWNFGSKLREDWEPNVSVWHLPFGTAVHAALEVWHNPQTWAWTKDERRTVLAALAVEAFLDSFKLPTGADGYPVTDPVQVAEWQEHRALGIGMVNNFIAQSHGKEDFTPRLVEIEFEVPIIVPSDMMGTVVSYLNFDVQKMEVNNNTFDVLHYKGIPVYYQGRLDMFVEDDFGNYFIHDWKTAGKFDDLAWLDLEEQITSYCWAFQILLSVQVKGFVYSELFKGVPGEPEVLKSGKLSKNKAQNVTKETYLAAIDRLHLPVEDYSEFLDYLENNERQWFRRTLVQRSQKELEIAGRRIVLEAMDMVSDETHIYPSPSKGNCNWCDFRAPCILKQEGGDYEWALVSMFHRRG